MEKSCLLCHIRAAFYSALRYFYNCVLLTHRALLLTSSGQIEVKNEPLGVIIQIIQIENTKELRKSIKQIDYQTI